MDTKKLTTLDDIKQIRFDRFVAGDKDPYICYRFVVALEKLLPLKLTQIKPVMMHDEATTADRMIIETTRDGVFERYIVAAAKDYFVTHEQLEEIKDLAYMYMDYLGSNAIDRLRWFGKDKEKWKKYI